VTTAGLQDVNRLALPELYRALAAGGFVRRVIELARDEDLGQAGDVTSEATIAPGVRGEATLRARQAGVLAGLEAIGDVIAVFDPAVRFEARARDGETIAPGQPLGEFAGPLRSILAIERTALNLVSRLSGIATRTAEYVRAAGRPVVYDTRKTTPGLRVLEKYAVRCGGGLSHRLGLHDAMLIKDNHLAGCATPAELASFVAQASARARARHRLAFVEVEVDTLEQFDALLGLAVGTIDLVLLDNMDAERLREAVARRNARRPELGLEASGGVNLGTIGAIAATGVDRISVGALTHGAVSLDLGLDIDAAPHA
jgi:nicotinate-nucleotide pyrophosphorylase (carboxylating)